MKARRHTLAVTLYFDKPVTAPRARREARDNIYGTFYPTAYLDSDAGTMKVRAFRPLPTNQKAITHLEKAITYLEDGSRITAMQRLIKALVALAPNSKVLAKTIELELSSTRSHRK